MPPSLTLNLKVARGRAEGSVQGARYENEYIAECDTVLNQGEILQLLPTATPEHIDYGDTFPGDPKAYCVIIEVRPKGESKKLWEVTARFEPEGAGGGVPVSPLLRDPEVWWGRIVENRGVFLDYSTPTRKQIRNSAGEPFDTLPQRRFGQMYVEITRNEGSPDFDLLDELDGTVNSTAMTLDSRTIPAGRALLEIGSRIPKIKEYGVTYYRVTYTFYLKRQVLGPPTSATVGWNPIHLLDLGYNRKTPFGLLPICDEDGMPVRKAWPLDGAGNDLPNPDDPAAELPFNLFQEADHTVLGL